MDLNLVWRPRRDEPAVQSDRNEFGLDAWAEDFAVAPSLPNPLGQPRKATPSKSKTNTPWRIGLGGGSVAVDLGIVLVLLFSTRSMLH